MSTSLRRAEPGDQHAMAALEAKAADHPWSAGQYADSIAGHHCWLLEKDNRLVGLLVYSRVLDEVELLNIAVDPAYQGKGLGRRLLELLTEKTADGADRVFLEVRESNGPAVGLYRRFGFTLSGRRRNYYPATGGREDALLMCYEF